MPGYYYWENGELQRRNLLRQDEHPQAAEINPAINCFMAILGPPPLTNRDVTEDSRERQNRVEMPLGPTIEEMDDGYDALIVDERDSLEERDPLQDRNQSSPEPEPEPGYADSPGSSSLGTSEQDAPKTPEQEETIDPGLEPSGQIVVVDPLPSLSSDESTQELTMTSLPEATLQVDETPRELRLSLSSDQEETTSERQAVQYAPSSQSDHPLDLEVKESAGSETAEPADVTPTEATASTRQESADKKKKSKRRLSEPTVAVTTKAVLKILREKEKARAVRKRGKTPNTPWAVTPIGGAKGEEKGNAAT